MAKVTVGAIPETDYSSYSSLLDFPHLYKSINDDFSTPGITLTDTLTCIVTWNRNEFPTLEMTYPRDGSHMLDIQKNRYIMADTNRKFVHQLFKITHVIQEMDQVTVSAEHIAATLNDATVPDGIQFANVSAQDLMNQVLNTMQPVKDFTFDSSVTTVSNVNVEKGQQAGSILTSPDAEGDEAINSVLGLYGGELEFDNNKIYHSEHAGSDAKIVIDYGKNMSAFNHDISTENMWTGAVFIATYTPGQAVAKADWGGWSSWSSDYSNVGIYAAGGTVQIFNSPVEGHQAIGTISQGMKLHLGKAIHNGDFTPDGKYQINTVNSDDWYPVSPEDGGGYIDARWISFDQSGSYMVNDVTGTLTVQGQDPNDDSSGAGSRVSMSGSAVVAYKEGGSIQVFYSPEIGNDHYPRPGETIKNDTVVHYDMVERNSQGDMWYRIGPQRWIYGPHLSFTQNGAYKSYSNTGNGYIKTGSIKYHWDKKKKQMVATTQNIYIKRNQSSKKVKVKAHAGRVSIDKTLTQRGVTYHHTKYGWVTSDSLSYYHNGNVHPQTPDQVLQAQIKDNSKVEMYATPDKNNAMNWSIPSGTQITIDSGHQAKGGDGNVYVEVTYAGKTGWISANDIDALKSNLYAPGSNDDTDDSGDDSNTQANVDTSHNEVTVKVGPLYAEGFGTNPNIDKVNTVDISSNFKHDDQDLSGQQADGTFVATQADIDQVNNIGNNYLIEHRYGQVDIQDTISYQEMSGINANWSKLSLYDYVTVKYDKYQINEKEEVNSITWNCLDHHYESIAIGKLPQSWQHLLLQQATSEASSATGAYVERTQGWLNRFENMLNSESSDRRAKENSMMDNLGMIQDDITWKDDKGQAHKLKDVFLETRQEFENHFQQLDGDATDIKNWIDQPGTGIIQAVPNWQAPQQLTAKSSNGGKMVFGANGLEFYDENSNKLLTGMDSQGRLYADSIEGITVNAMTINALVMHGNLVSEDPNGSMKIFIGTQNPGSTLNPLQNGRAIWVTSDNYSSMTSSGQFAITSGQNTTRIHPSGITVNDDDNEVLTQENFAGHAYYRIKSWVEAWIADYITVGGVKHNIWLGIDKGTDMGKLRDLQGQGTTNYGYDPGSNDDYGSDSYDDSDENGIDLDDTSDDDQDESLHDSMYSDTTDGMITWTGAFNLGLHATQDHNYTEALGSTKLGNDGHLYQLKIYTGTNQAHWYFVS